MKKSFVFVSAILVIAAGAAAQTAQGPEKSNSIVTERVVIGKDKPVFLMEMDGMGKIVTGAPYTANATTETTQTLGDGNHIVKRTTTFLARDSEGRTRREESFPQVGNLEANASKSVMINDPVAHVEYFVQPGAAGKENSVFLNVEDYKENRLVRHRIEENKDKLQALSRAMVISRSGLAAEGGEDAGETKHESLGTQVMEGMPVAGVRDTRTIPAGAIGNEKPIVITSEVWTSPDLQVVVFSRRNDPRFGETVYKLTDVNRSEPDPALFQLPEKVKKDVLPVK